MFQVLLITGGGSVKDPPSGSRLAMSSAYKNISLVAVRYKYKSKKNHCFIMMLGSGSTFPTKDDPYKLKFRGKFGNTPSQPMGRPEVLNRYYAK